MPPIKYIVPSLVQTIPHLALGPGLSPEALISFHWNRPSSWPRLIELKSERMPLSI